ncbi:ubiquinol oxidase subunit II [Paenibacillus protaetiae]|uniref:Quinol oxidase subunit 2 n=2 Tax=Paenibacillus protaetiae TaxID=2509456 RepID=A0A4V0YFQ4_9BACL|nr:ubiquinol oxidase subunit II [Paenibacillus protaetiae]QAY68521.1 ubiquinol oxidase subunit II [Paenibacillus protaetiae]
MVMAVMLSGCSGQYLVLDPKGPIGESQRDLIYISAILCAVILVPVLIMTAVIVWRYRENNKKVAYKPKWEHSTKLETLVWGVPTVIIIILAAFTIKYTYDLEPSKAIASEHEPVTIEVTSLDWKWLFTYPDEGIATVNYLKFPEGVPIRFHLTSDQAMNSFWIPQLGGQIYTMSGMAMTLYLQADEAGEYYGSGANFTGEDFSKMTFKADAVSNEDYNAWVQQVKSSSPELTMDGYHKLAEKGTSDEQSFSSFPKGLFQQIVMQYMNGSDMPMHHGNSESAGSDKDMGDMDMDGMDKDMDMGSSEHANH